jgi:hypothetical protein
MKFKTKTMMFITRAELRASAQLQDQLANLNMQVAESLGICPSFKLPSKWEQVKIALGQDKFETYGPLSISYSRKGVTFVIEVEDEIPEEVTVEIFRTYMEIINIFSPVITSAIAGISLADKMAKERVNKARKRISKSLAKQ